MKQATGLIIIIIGLVLAIPGCGPKYETVTYPPRIDLSRHELIGVIEFQSSEEGELGPLATRRFTESARRDQGLVRVIWLDSEDERPDAKRIRELGREHGLRTIVVGKLTVSDVRPRVSISRSLSSGSLSASVEATLAVEMIETSTGASLWNASGDARRTLGNLSVFGDQSISFDAEDPESAYGLLIDALVSQVTRDFHNTWGRQPIRQASAASR
jgi:hypothetical protein